MAGEDDEQPDEALLAEKKAAVLGQVAAFKEGASEFMLAAADLLGKEMSAPFPATHCTYKEVQALLVAHDDACERVNRLTETYQRLYELSIDLNESSFVEARRAFIPLTLQDLYAQNDELGAACDARGVKLKSMADSKKVEEGVGLPSFLTD